MRPSEGEGLRETFPLFDCIFLQHAIVLANNAGRNLVRVTDGGDVIIKPMVLAQNPILIMSQVYPL